MPKEISMSVKLLFIVDSYNVGGTIVSLQSLLASLDTERYKVDVYAVSDIGPFRDKLTNCRVLDANPWLAKSSAGLSAGNRLLYKFLQMSGNFIARWFHKDLRLRFVRHGCKLINSLHYDYVVCFSEQLVQYVALFPARNRVTWIHCDYSRIVNDDNKNELANSLDHYNQIVCVSGYARNELLRIFPQFEDKTIAIHNIINEDYIRNRAEDRQGMDSRFVGNEYKIVSVGRLDPIKQFHLIPLFAEQIRRVLGPVFKWFIIGGIHGYDDEYNLIVSEIKDNHLEDIVILLGEKGNVYPYIQDADLFVCTSKSESFPLVVNEAKALGIPIISLFFPSVIESIKEGVDGHVVYAERIPYAIVEHYRNPQLRKHENDSKEKTFILGQIDKLFSNKH